jgi:hypothetical protein
MVVIGWEIRENTDFFFDDKMHWAAKFCIQIIFNQTKPKYDNCFVHHFEELWCIKCVNWWQSFVIFWFIWRNNLSISLKTTCNLLSFKFGIRCWIRWTAHNAKWRAVERSKEVRFVSFLSGGFSTVAVYCSILEIFWTKVTVHKHQILPS